MLPLSSFGNNSRAPDGLMYICKECKSADAKKYNTRMKNRTAKEVETNQKKLYPSGKKNCADCKKDKPLEEFPLLSGSASGIRSYCSDCFSLRVNAYQKGLSERTDDELFSDIVRFFAPNGTALEDATKSCSQCEQVKSLNEFTLSKSAPSGARCECKDCQCDSRTDYDRSRKAIREEFKADGCEICGCIDIRVLELAHISRLLKARDHRGKPVSPSHLSRMAFEVEKDFLYVLCAYCHRLETQVETGGRMSSRRQSHRDIVSEEKEERGSCKDCGRHVIVGGDNDNTCAFDFDHLPGTEKIDCICALVNSKGTMDVIRKEMKKCDLCCANCHRIRTNMRGQINPVTPRVGILDHYRRYLASKTSNN